MKVFTRNLVESIVPNSDVYELQVWLEKNGYGNFVPTGIFGKKTRNAVAKFQKEHNIQPWVGNFGEKTRRKINLLNFSKKEILHATAVSMLGIDASPDDRAPDELACAETVNQIALLAIGVEIGGGLSTTQMQLVMENNPSRFKRVSVATAGSIVIYPTRGNKIGHVLIMDKDGKTLMSNSSSTSLFTRNYTKESARRYWVTGKGLTEYIYDII